MAQFIKYKIKSHIYNEMNRLKNVEPFHLDSIVKKKQQRKKETDF